MTKEESKLDLKETVGLVYEYLLDNQIMNLVYDSGIHRGSPVSASPPASGPQPIILLLGSTGGGNPPVTVAEIFLRAGWGTKAGKTFVAISSSMMAHVDVDDDFLHQISYGTNEIEIPLEHPKSFPMIIEFLEKITIEYNKTAIEWNKVGAFLFTNHMVYDDLELSELHLKRPRRKRAPILNIGRR